MQSDHHNLSAFEDFVNLLTRRQIFDPRNYHLIILSYFLSCWCKLLNVKLELSVLLTQIYEHSHKMEQSFKNSHKN